MIRAITTGRKAPIAPNSSHSFRPVEMKSSFLCSEVLSRSMLNLSLRRHRWSPPPSRLFDGLRLEIAPESSGLRPSDSLTIFRSLDSKGWTVGSGYCPTICTKIDKLSDRRSATLTEVSLLHLVQHSTLTQTRPSITT
jgi:hypothetical protein